MGRRLPTIRNDTECFIRKGNFDMQVVARKFTHAEFKSYLDGLKIPPWARFVVVHNTSSPDIRLYRDDWMKRPPAKWTPEIWLRNLVSYYSNMGWKGGPHLFIPPAEDQILVLNSLLVPGTHTPSWNRFSIGVETVGEFEREPFEDPTHANLVAALAMLHEKLGLRPDGYSLGVSGLHFHKEDHATTHKTCPGRNMMKANLVSRVLAAMDITPGLQTPDDTHHDIPIASQEADTNHMSIEELTSVKWLQTMLNRWNHNQEQHGDGEPLLVDGARGKKTTDAVRAFQTALYLTADGIPGPVTRAALKTAVKG